MFGVEHRVGRLIEMHATALSSVAQLEALNARFREIVGRVDAKRFIVIADYRAMPCMPAEVAERFAQLLTAHNPRIERGAILCAPHHPDACERIERAVERANHPSRRAFREAADAIAWLGEVLSDDERDRLIDFVRRK